MFKEAVVYVAASINVRHSSIVDSSSSLNNSSFNNNVKKSWPCHGVLELAI